MPIHPGDRERRRWANLVLEGRIYTDETPHEVIHDHLRRAPRVTLRNLRRASFAGEVHKLCSQCEAILAEPDPLPPHLR